MPSASPYLVVLFGGVALPPIAPQSETPHALLWNAHRLFGAMAPTPSD